MQVRMSKTNHWRIEDNDLLLWDKAVGKWVLAGVVHSIEDASPTDTGVSEAERIVQEVNHETR